MFFNPSVTRHFSGFLCSEALLKTTIVSWVQTTSGSFFVQMFIYRSNYLDRTAWHTPTAVISTGGGGTVFECSFNAIAKPTWVFCRTRLRLSASRRYSDVNAVDSYTRKISILLFTRFNERQDNYYDLILRQTHARDMCALSTT